MTTGMTPADPVRLLADLRRRVGELRTAMERMESVRRACYAAAAVLAGTVLLVLAEAAGSFSVPVRTAMFFVWTIVVVLLPAAYAALPLLRSFGFLRQRSLREVALIAGERFPVLRDRLANVLDLAPSVAAERWVSSDLAAEAIRSVHADAASLRLEESIDRTAMRNARNRFGIVAAVCVVITALAPTGLGDAMLRLRAFRTPFEPPLRYRMTVSPGDAEFAKGTDVTISADVVREDGRGTDITDDVVLRLRPDGQDREETIPMRPTSPGRFAALLAAVKASADYHVRVADEASQQYRMTVLDWPSFQSLRIRLEAPPYTRLPSVMQDDFAANITALPGTVVRVSGRATKPLAGGRVEFTDSVQVAMSVTGSTFEARFVVARPTGYRVRVRDTEGLENPFPVLYEIRVRPDEHPTVAILEPGRNLDIAGHEPVRLFIRASDDFGFSALTLRYRLSHSRYEQVSPEFRSLPLPLPSRTSSELDVSHLWDLDQLHLVPEDVVEYFVEVADNDAVSGPKTARSAMFTLRLPSLEEVFTDLDKGHDTQAADLGKALQEAQELKKTIEQLDQDLKTNKDFDWQKQQQAREMSKQVDDIRQKLDQAKQQLEQMTEQMQRQQVLSPETLEKYLELQNLFQQIDAQELQSALRQMQQAMEGLRKDQLEQALRNVEFSEERFRQGIERTINLLKRIQIEQKMDEARRRADELREQQEELARQPADDDGRDARRQEELAKQQEHLERSLEDLQERMEEFFTEMPSDRLGEMNRRLDEQQLDRTMQEAARQLRQGNRPQAERMQQQAQQGLQQLSQELSALQQQLLAQQTEQILNALRRATQDLLEISQRQESIRNDARSAAPQSAALRENAQDQMRAMQDLQNVIADIAQLAQKSFAVTPDMGRALGEAMGSMQQAMRDLDVRNGAMAAQDQTGAMAALNRAAQQVQRSLQAMMEGAQGSPGGMGLMQQLQMMAGMQAGLNAQTQRMGEGEAMRRAAEAARLAREQDAVRKSLEQLQQEARASGEQQRILGDLNRIAEEMKEVVRDLEQNNADSETIRRQERILSRLLDASRSMRERDFEKRRQATTGRQILRGSPGEIHSSDTRTRLRQELLRALERGYARDYQELIRKYFDELERMEGGGE